MQVKPKKFIPKQEKVDDIKLAKELLKRRKGERAVSPVPPTPEPRSPSPKEKVVEVVPEVGTLFHHF